MDPLAHVFIRQVDSAHGDYWFEAVCDFCGWATDGWESNVEDWGYEHVTDIHPRRLANRGTKLSDFTG
jgi:hypothetical protein